MSLRLNALILGTVVAATFAVGMAGAESTTPTIDASGKSDSLFATGTLSAGPLLGAVTIAGDTLTVEYRGENLSFLARVPLSP